MLKKMIAKHHATDGAMRGRRPSFTSATVTIAAGGMKSMGLGVYDIEDPEPIFAYTCSPSMEDCIGASLERLNLPGQPKYMLLYQFHNYGDKECRIDVERQEA